MSVEMKTVREIVNATGLITYGKGKRLPVQFDLVETQDFYSDWPGPRFTYGDLHFEQDVKPALLDELALNSTLRLTTDGFEAQIHLHQTIQGTQFTVVRMSESIGSHHFPVLAVA